MDGDQSDHGLNRCWGRNSISTAISIAISIAISTMNRI